MAGRNDPFAAVTDEQEAAAVAAEQQLLDEANAQAAPTSGLGDAALAAIGSEGQLDGATVQDPLDGTDFSKVRFQGVGYDSLETDFKLGEERTFIVRGKCVANGLELVGTDQHERRIVKFKVDSVREYDPDHDAEPEK